jgi:Thioesterase domain
MPILVGIDGTDDSWRLTDERNARYDRNFANSFVRRLCAGKNNGRYYRGPLADGGYLHIAINEGVTFIQSKKRSFPNEPVLLTGYSRGALGAVVIAQRLKDLNIQVKALMMFDCVDRHVAYDADVIPDNVEFVCHVIRNPAARSRATFGNDGMNYNPRTTNFPRATMFMCTHGGMGGVPWTVPAGGNPNDFIDEGTMEALASPVRNEPVWTYRTNVTYAQDAAESQRVWRHVQPFLNTHGFLRVS